MREKGCYEVIFNGELAKHLATWQENSGLWSWLLNEEVYQDSDFKWIASEGFNVKTDCDGHPMCECGLCVDTWCDIAKDRRKKK